MPSFGHQLSVRPKAVYLQTLSFYLGTNHDFHQGQINQSIICDVFYLAIGFSLFAFNLFSLDMIRRTHVPMCQV